MVALENFGWETCAEDDCIGVRLPSGGKCWAHADHHDLDAALKRLGEDGRLDARGVSITTELLRRLLAAAPQNEHSHRSLFAPPPYKVLTDAQFDRATFLGDTMFSGVTFEGATRFSRATFQGETWFGGATFQGTVSFEGATFESVGFFSGATFEGDTLFDDATFQDAGWFDATFQGETWFGGATFQRHARFLGATFQHDASFSEATFQRDVDFRRAVFRRDAGFDGATFQQACQLGPMLVRKAVVLDQAVFHQRAQIEVAAAALCCRRTRFVAGVQLGVRWAQVVLDDAYLAAPSILTGVPRFAQLDEDSFVRVWRRLRRPPYLRDGRPRLLSLRRADVAGLTVAGANMRGCRFAGAHHLDQLRVEESDFADTPPGGRWTNRKTIAEEHHWRAAHSHRDPASTAYGHEGIAMTARSDPAARKSGWYRPGIQPPSWLEVELPSAAQVAALYRALRKGREDNKDEPGAADFYYGEMEMRRHAKRGEVEAERRRGHQRHWATAASEYAILWLYWLASGYGLRAWRALMSFLVLLIVAAGLFAFAGGFASATATAGSPAATTVASPTQATQPPPTTLPRAPVTTTATADTSFGGALVYSARTVIGLTREPQPRLTRFGDVVQILIRILGPVLLGLAVLSVRGRVKR